MWPDLQPEESFLAAWAPGQVLIRKGGLAKLQSRITATAVWEIGICECFWGEVVEKQAQFPQAGLAACKIAWKCATDEKPGDPCLPEKAWQTDVHMNVFFHSHFPLETHERAAVSRLNRRSLQRESHLFPFGHQCVVCDYPRNDGHVHRRTFTRWHSQTGLSEYIGICLIFQAGKQKDISSVLSESASLWRFQFTPVTNLVHTVAFYGSFHGQSLFSWVVTCHKLL